ncbi:MAG TPA: sialidase family protein, partial [Candidatus Udaeobacter sp.]|nr:sialidase family protein [Candidatus Udaeobacter sp.]
MRPAFIAAAVLAITLVSPSFSIGAGNARLSHDDATGNYVSLYTQNTGVAYDDAVLQECRIARGRQNEPSDAMDPRNPSVILGSSNDYCGVYQPAGATVQQPVGPIWLGYYRSQDGGTTFTSTLVPGYPGDTSPYAALAHIRTASSGDPVIAWDNHGRAFFGSESSDDPAGTKKTFGDVWVATFDNPAGEGGASANDGKRFVRSEVVARGSSAPNLLGKFNDKTAIEADRSGSSCDANVYFAYSRFTGNGGVAIYFSRSTDHGATWSSPKKLSSATDVQFPDISVTGNGHVYVTWRTFMAKKHDLDSIQITKSTDCGATFGTPNTIGT